eukprot:TRINITY_DN6160_c0_g6_i1.p2 TRINITY_DN6160_c0_g6~~TRINITY_DN6160_c0_g6_i1.p2  ORF type:complete len:100 (+),score=30.80 TRINITY_DN6160_c0_g6_i1:106-405(+)
MVGLSLLSILAGWVKEIEKGRKRIEIEIGRSWGPHDWWPTKIVVMEGCRWSINNKKEEDRMEERMNGEGKRERREGKNEMGGLGKSTHVDSEWSEKERK